MTDTQTDATECIRKIAFTGGKSSYFKVDHETLTGATVVEQLILCMYELLCYRGDVTPAVIEEYEVGPLPFPSGYSRINHSQWRTPIPYTVRPYDTQLDSELWDEFICRQMNSINSILRDVTGHTYSADCQHHCLIYRCDVRHLHITCVFITLPAFTLFCCHVRHL